MSDRTPCAVPGCRCSTKDPYPEWVCAKHWRRVVPALRDRFNEQKRLARRIVRRKPLYRTWWLYPPGSSDRLAAIRLWRELDATWDRIKKAAAEVPEL